MSQEVKKGQVWSWTLGTKTIWLRSQEDRRISSSATIRFSVVVPGGFPAYRAGDLFTANMSSSGWERIGVGYQLPINIS